MTEETADKLWKQGVEWIKRSGSTVFSSVERWWVRRAAPVKAAERFTLFHDVVL